jgi:hypothetical protein
MKSIHYFFFHCAKGYNNYILCISLFYYYSSHWFLGIICFPGLTSPVRMSDSTAIQIPEKKKANDKVKSKIFIPLG